MLEDYEIFNDYLVYQQRENGLTRVTVRDLHTQQQQQLRARLQESMTSVRETRMELLPMMKEMVAVLTAFVGNDIPFLWQERQLRLTELKRLLADANVSVADKYRRILEAYQIETEYGDTIETWQAQLPLADSEKTVQLVRVGRVALYYLTPDQHTAGYWDNSTRTWLILPDSWLPKVKQAYAVADNKTVPTLLALPLLEASINTGSETQPQEAL
jgi:hypothetical protein